MSDEQETVIINACMERRLNGFVDQLRQHYMDQGYNVLVFRTGAGNPDAIEGDLREAHAKNKVVSYASIPHVDCGWVRVGASALYLDGKVSEVLFDEYSRVFEGFKPNLSPEDKKNPAKLAELHGRMEDWAAQYFERRAIEILGKDVKLDSPLRPNAKTLEAEAVIARVVSRAGGEHTRSMIIAESSTHSSSELIVQSQQNPQEVLLQTYILSGGAVRHAELAPAVHASKVFLVGTPQWISKKEGEIKKVLDRIPKDQHRPEVLLRPTKGNGHKMPSTA